MVIFHMFNHQRVNECAYQPSPGRSAYGIWFSRTILLVPQLCHPEPLWCSLILNYQHCTNMNSEKAGPRSVCDGFGAGKFLFGSSFQFHRGCRTPRQSFEILSTTVQVPSQSIHGIHAAQGLLIMHHVISCDFLSFENDKI